MTTCACTQIFLSVGMVIHMRMYTSLPKCWYGYMCMYTTVTMVVVTIAAQGTRSPRVVYGQSYPAKFIFLSTPSPHLAIPTLTSTVFTAHHWSYGYSYPAAAGIHILLQQGREITHTQLERYWRDVESLSFITLL